MKNSFKHDVECPMSIQHIQCQVSNVHSTNPLVIFFCPLPVPQRAPQDCGQKSLRETLCLQTIMITGEEYQWKKMKGQS